MLLAHELIGHAHDPAIVLIHGITDSRHAWHPLLHSLAAHHLVLAVDLRGHGESDSDVGYDPISYATDVVETASALGVNDALVVGHSLGGVVASAFAAIAPCRAVINIDQSLRLSAFKAALEQLEPMLKGDDESFQQALELMFTAMDGPLSASEQARLREHRRPDQAVVLATWAAVFESTEAELDATVEALAASNEALQSTNEELMSSNEELQSSNEELQSVNEELNTVNAEYQEKIDILNRLNADLDNMAQAVAAGPVFVDELLNLTRFSPDATHIFKLRESDIGRPLDDLAHTLLYPELIADLARTLRDEARVEQEIPGINGLHYFVRMLPYRVPSSDKKGAVITFMDVTALHEASRLPFVIATLSNNKRPAWAEYRLALPDNWVVAKATNDPDKNMVWPVAPGDEYDGL